MDIVKITFNDNTVHEYKKGTSFYDASKDYNMNNIVGYKIKKYFLWIIKYLKMKK